MIEMRSSGAELETSKRSGLAKKLSFAAVPLIFVAVIAWATVGKTSRVFAGQPAPDFSATSFDGSQVSLSDFRGRPLFINFWASWCIPCIEEAPDLRAAHEEFSGTDVIFLGVNSEDLKDDAEQYLLRHELEYTNVRDASGEISSRYGVRAYPESFFIAGDGTVVDVVYGPMTAAELRARINDLLSDSGS